MNSKQKTFSPCACALTVLLSSQPIMADNVLEEIIVTAQKRAENLQEVPVAISAFSAETLEKLGLTNTNDISLVTPGLQMGQQLGASTPFLRGIGIQNGAPGNEANIATYVDEVYNITQLSNTFSFNNIERIEVLKGPQGTLFGRNATGGLIHVITRDPTDELSGELEVSYGDYETGGVKAYISSGLSDSISADLAIIHTEQGEGYGDNLLTGKEVYYKEGTSLRSKIVFDISDNARLKLGLAYSETEGDFGVSRQPAPGTTGSDGVTGYTGDWHDIAADLDSFHEVRDKLVSIHYEHSFNNFDFVSISAYQASDALQILDNDYVSLPLLHDVLAQQAETFTQEFRISSTSDSRLRWMAGLFFLEARAGYDPINLYGILPPLIFGGELFATNNQDTESYSGFVQGSYDFTDATSLTVGVRLTKDVREYQSNLTLDIPGDGQGFLLFDDGTLEEDWTEPTWRISLEHFIAEDTMAYFSYSRGFKSGVYNVTATNANPALGPLGEPVDPETLDAYELGIKADLLGKSLRVNASLFYYDYTDMQLNKIEAGVSVLLNAAEAEIQGLEADITWLPSDTLSISGGFSIVDSEFSKFPGAPSFTPSVAGNDDNGGMDVAGNELPRAPELTYNLTALYSLPTDHGEYNASLNYYYNDGFFWEPENRHAQDDYQVVNAELAWTSPSDTWSVRVYGKNLSDEEYSYFGISTPFGDSVSAAPPRTYGAAVKFSF